MSDFYLNPGLAQPVSTQLDEAYWHGLRENDLRVQRCDACRGWQWGPEWICHHCHADTLSFERILAHGVIYSYERVWHPVLPGL